jgi:hypothetical protein
MFKLLPDDSSRAKFLTEEEKQFVVERLQDETGTGVGVIEVTDKMNRERIINRLKDWKVYLGVVRHPIFTSMSLAHLDNSLCGGIIRVEPMGITYFRRFI